MDALRPVSASVDSWVVGGDFNNIESALDYQAEVAPVLTSIAPSEQDAWERFLLGLQVDDAWRTPAFAHQPCSLLFSWGLRRQQGRLLERLDRFYVGLWAAQLGGSICIWPGTSMSDHCPVSLMLTFDRPLAERRGCRIPDSVLSCGELSGRIEQIWSADHASPDHTAQYHSERLATCISESSIACREFTMARGREAAQRERSLLAPLASVQRLLQAHPGDAHYAARQSELLAEIREVQERRSEFSSHTTAARWVALGDRMNKDFFAAHRERPPGTYLRAVIDEQGVLETRPDHVLDIASSFYETLFTADTVTEDIQAARDIVWSHTRCSVTADMGRSLCARFSLQELREAVDALDPSSCPGVDGLTRQFFISHWDVLSRPLLSGLQEIYDTGYMPRSLCSGIISLIPKGGDSSLLRQWRPITLLPTVYKILATLLGARVRPLLPDIIHGSQTAFIQDRCILDNIFCYHQAVEWARSTATPLALLFLDFEKAYDRVDWSFLEGTLARMGFPQQWITGVSALYRSASSAVTIGGYVGRSFDISRSVRQGCPLAVYLYLFVGEALSDFIHASQRDIQGVTLPLPGERDLVDQEYADDTLLMVLYAIATLDATRSVLDLYCLASGARINWHKSYGMIVGSEDHPTWGVTDGFTWLRPGQSCRYLGFQVGLDITPQQQFAPVMQSLRRKLSHWSSQHLSLAGRALVANQVLLASVWYIASCWMLHTGVMRQVRRLIRNFLWGGGDGSTDTRARVSWATIILPVAQGGLGIIDPEMQCRALLTKFIVRGLFPGNETWKMLFRSVIHTVVPRFGTRDGHSWAASVRYIFSDAPLLTAHLSPFMRSILQIWVSMRMSLQRRPPASLAEIERQPLIWNCHVLDAEGRQLGQRTHIDWASWDSGPAASMLTWSQTRQLQADFIAEEYAIGRGILGRRTEIDAAIPDLWDRSVRGLHAMPEHLGWVCMFGDEGTPSLVWCQHGHFPMLFIPIGSPDAFGHVRLQYYGLGCRDELQQYEWTPIRVVGSYRKRREVDPSFHVDMAPSWRLWIWEGRPLAQLAWDPGEWQWPAVEPGAGDVSFFSYTVRIGRHCLLRRSMHRPTRLGAWLHGGLSHAFLTQYWSTIWRLRISRRITTCFWMAAHAGHTVGSWAATMGHDPFCLRCDQQLVETQAHCFWSCTVSYTVWRAVALLLSRAGLHAGFLTWGTVLWLLPWPGPHLFFEGEDTDPVLMLTATGYSRGSLAMIPPRTRQMEHWQRDEIFTVTVAIALWNIWRARCLHVLSDTHSSTSGVLAMIWVDLIRSLRSMYDSSCGPSRSAQDRREVFIRRWGRTTLFFRIVDGQARWEYCPPQWFILHTSHIPP